jgi:dihydrofolate synthase/folylpolyglutamate synthase
MTDAYRAALTLLYGRLNYERADMPRLPSELRLGRMRRLLRALGDPHDGLRIIHVAGTKGKGSTAAMLAAALTAAGIRTGLFCSPHLHQLEERFRIDGRDATPDEVVTMVEPLRPIVAELDADDSRQRYRGLTFFDLTTAMGLLHFARRRVGAVVLEVGLGGRLDSTNVVRPELAILTTISYDHTKQLGSTLGSIAREKAGILKRNTPAVSGVRGDEARAVIRDVARLHRSPLREVDVDYHLDYHAPVPPIVHPTVGRVSVRTWRQDWGTLDVPLLGGHQAQNAAVALAALDVLAERGIEVGRDAVVRGFAGLRFPARVEVVGDRPWQIIDGAHNVASAEALAEALEFCVPPGSRTLVFGTTRDKDLAGQLRVLLPLFDRVVATRYVENPRSVSAEDVATTVRALDGPTAAIEPNPASALALAKQLTPQGGVICVTGSLFLAAEARAILLGLKPGRCESARS